MSVTAYLFEARSVQRFLFEGGKLADMVAASDMLNALCDGPLDAVIRAAGLSEASSPAKNHICFSRRAGGAVFALFACEEEARRFQALWSLYVQQQFPGLETVQCCKTDETEAQALQLAIEGLRAARNCQTPRLPLASPLTRRSPRTGQIAVRWDRNGREWVDEMISPRRLEKKTRQDILCQRFCDSDDYTWPKELNELYKHRDEVPRVALIHADGNGIGELLHTIAGLARDCAASSRLAPSELYRTFSEALKEAT
ncbi:MAG: hypothetical protein OIF57_12755, partial [Marinobacterium sp.]|nr:hypothetical protein [Marinobacterium sp.]